MTTLSPPLIHVGKVIARLREERRWNQTELASKAGLTFEAVHVIEDRAPKDLPGATRAAIVLALAAAGGLSPVDGQILGEWAGAGRDGGTEARRHGGTEEAKVNGPRRIAITDGFLSRLIDERGLAVAGDVDVLACTPDDLCRAAYRGEAVEVHILDRIIIALDRWKALRPAEWIKFLEATYAIDGWDAPRCYRLLRACSLMTGRGGGGGA